MSKNITNDFGLVTPNKVEKVENLPDNYIRELLVFQPRDVPYKGYIKWSGKINSEIMVYGIESINPIKMGTNGSFNNHKLFESQEGCGVIVEQSAKLLKIDKDGHFILESTIYDFNYEYKYKHKDLIVVGINETLKVGTFSGCGKINDIKCYQIKFIENNKEYIFVANDILGEFTTNGLIRVDYDGKYNIENQDYVFDAKINDEIIYKFDNEVVRGKLKWKGLIDGFKCLAIVPENSKFALDFRKCFSNSNAFWAVICLDAIKNMNDSQNFNLENMNDSQNLKIFRQILEPHQENISTYFKMNAYVCLDKNDDKVRGIVKSFLLDYQNDFYYEVKLESMDETKFYYFKEVKCASPTYIQEKAFEKINSPLDYGIITNFKIDDSVHVKPTDDNGLKKECSGVIVWMGFDQDSTFKFFLRLDSPNDKGNNGVLYGFHITDVPEKRGLLVLPSCLVTKNNVTKKSEIETKFQNPLPYISIGTEKGIQGDRNSCYMDTSLFAMFTFQGLFDNLLYTNDKEDPTIHDLQETLRSHIIFPLRRYEYVTFDKVSVFRNKLNTIFPTKKFIHSERDPEELLETLFHFLTPRDPLLNTFHIKTKIKQSCFLTQLFYVKDAQGPNVNIGDMLNWTFLEGEIMIDKPPKCLILQLPRHGTKYKKYDEVMITPSLDITHLIRCCQNKCRECTRDSCYFCKKCSDKNFKFEYFCGDHKDSCVHEKLEFKKDICAKCILNTDEIQSCSHENDKKSLKGKVILELFAILCIEKTHYVAYVKTGQVTSKWIYFDSMAAFDNNELKPLIREAYLNDYFQNGVENDSNAEDVMKIKKFAFVCFYKNPTMEYYRRDFNHTEG